MKWVLLSFVLILIACKQNTPEYKGFSDAFTYKFIALGEEDPILEGQTILANLIITSLSNDTIHYVPDYPYFFRVGKTPFDSLLRQFKLEDSIVIRASRADFLERFNFFQLAQSKEDTVLMHFKIIKALNAEEVNDEKQKILSLREIKEQEKLIEFLTKNENEFENLEGIYRKVLSTTNGNKILNGSEVSLHYCGKFLDGFVFDNTYQKGMTPSFTYGKEYQLLEGIQIGLKGLKEGETAKIILPSQLAFREGGSLAGIVPPFTAVIFEIEIIKVIN